MQRMHIMKGNVSGSPNVGLFGFDAGPVVLFGERLRTKQRQQFEEVLGKPLLNCKIAGTNLPGVFLAGNSRTLLVPQLLYDSEERVLRDAGISYTILRTEVTCLGNSIACTDTGAIVSTEFSEKEVATIGRALGVKTVQMDIAGLTTPGAVIVVNGTRAVIHKDATDAEVRIVERTLGVTASPATVNMGSSHLLAGILRSDRGLIVGDLSGGPEVVNIDEALGYHSDDDADESDVSADAARSRGRRAR